MQDKRQLKISFSHTGTLNVMQLRLPADRITSILSMGDLGIDISIHDTSNHDLLEANRAITAELVERGVKAAVKPVVMTPAEWAKL